MTQQYLYKVYSKNNFRKIPQISRLPENKKREIEIVSTILPFKTNNYVVDELINWYDVPGDPMYTLTFPRREMLQPDHYDKIEDLINSGSSPHLIQNAANEIRMELNPHPSGQMDNIPSLNGNKLKGIQHKYRETVLFFPSQGQTCHAYCTFCFRWPQFVGMDELKFAMNESKSLVDYLKIHTEVTDVLFTGGDPMVMSIKYLNNYFLPLLSDELNHIQTIRIGTKSLSYWPYKFVSDQEADEVLQLFETIVNCGKNLAIMAHFNHPVELQTEIVKTAISRIRSTGAQIRTQSPVLNHINNDPDLWAEMWRKQVNLNCIPYYMFVERDTGAQHFFALPLVKAWEIFREAYQKVSGVCRTVRGPSMSAGPGKIQILGVSEIQNEKVFVLRFIQGRNPDWVAKPFFAKYNENAIWWNDLQPAFNEENFFFEKELAEYSNEQLIALN